MKWTVVWLKEAEEKLANAWLNSTEKVAIAEASNRIEGLLRLSPEKCGTKYDQHLRLLICHPLAIIFSIDEPNRIVRILGVQAFR